MDSAARELTRHNVISSRIRLARNVRGMSFPHVGRRTDPAALAALERAAVRAAQGVFDCELLRMSGLDSVKKTALIERHLISPALTANTASGAVLLERSESVSVMLNEEDRIREQCIVHGFDLPHAYGRLNVYDDRLLDEIPVAYDPELGFLTACPTNLGTGMRASVMLFLPALKLAGAIEDEVNRFVREYGMTVRGVYGEGSEAKGDMYQISNTRTLGVTEEEIISSVERAALEMCLRESEAREKLVRRKGAALYDKVARSYGILTNAYKLTSAELMNMISDVKLGVILDILPLKDTETLDKLLVWCSAANLTAVTGECSPTERDIRRAAIVKGILQKEKL